MHYPSLQTTLESAAKWAVVNSSAAALLFLGLVLVGMIWRRRLSNHWAYALGVLILVRLLIPATPSSRWSWLNWKEKPERSTVESTETSPLPVPEERIVQWTEPTWEPRNLPAAEFDIKDPAILNEAPPPIQIIRPPPTRDAEVWNWRGAASSIWALVVAGMFGLTYFRHLQFSRRVKRSAVPAEFLPDDLLAECHQRAGVAARIPVLCLDALGTPAVFGFIKPKILLPASLAGQLDREQWRHILLHELAHVKGRDVLVNWFIIAARSVHWFNPLAWISLRRLVADRELVRDAQALRWLGADSARQSYGHTLLTLATLHSSTPPTPSLASLFHTRKELHRRIAMIKNPHSAQRRWLPLLAGASLLAAVCAITFTKAAADDKPVEERKAEPPKPEPLPAAEQAAADPAPAPIESAKPRAELPKPAEVDPLISQNSDDANFLTRLKSIVLPRVQFESATLDECLKFFHKVSVELDPEKRGVDFVLKGTPPKPVTLNLTEASLFDAVRLTCELADCAYRLDSGRIVVSADKNELVSKVFRCPPSLAAKFTAIPERTADSILADMAVSMPPGSSAAFSPATSRLVVKNTVANLDLIESLISALFQEGAASAKSVPAAPANHPVMESPESRLEKLEAEIAKLTDRTKRDPFDQRTESAGVELQAAKEVRQSLIKQIYREKYGVSAKDDAQTMDEDEALFAQASALHRDDRVLSEFYSKYTETKVAYQALLAEGAGPQHPKALALKAQLNGLHHILRNRAKALMSATKLGRAEVLGGGAMPFTSANDERRLRNATFRKKRADLMANQVELETRLQNLDPQFDAQRRQEFVELLIKTKKDLIFLEAEADSDAEPTQLPPARALDPPQAETAKPQNPSATKNSNESSPPFGTPVVGKKGFVYSPYAPEKGYVDVNRIPSGTKVQCPYTGKDFRVP